MHRAGHVGHIWRRAWGFLSWAPPPRDARRLTARWWPLWRGHLHVREMTRAPALAWVRDYIGDATLRTLHATRAVMDAPLGRRRSLALLDDARGRRRPVTQYRRRGHVFHWWCHGQLVGVLLARRRLVLGAVQKVTHQHLRRGWERRILLRGCGYIVYRQQTQERSVGGDVASFRWLRPGAGAEEEEPVVETWSLEPPFVIRRPATAG